MSNKKGSPRKTAPRKPQFKGFLNYRPNEAERSAIRESVIDWANTEQFLWQLMDAGIKLSISADNYHNTLQASISMVDYSSVNAGYVLVCRHDDVAVLLTLVRFVAFDLAETGTWEEICSEDTSNDW